MTSPQAVVRFALENPDARIPVLSHKQYEVLQDICSVLSILHNAQELLSAERTPTVALALPVYEALVHALREASKMFPELRYAIELGIDKIETYVAHARGVPVYALAMVVNPCLKFEWIDQHWSETERKEGRAIVKDKVCYVSYSLVTPQSTPIAP